MALTRSAALLALACAAALAMAPAALAQKPAKKKEKSAPAPEVLYAGRPDALRFADDLAARRGLDREWVRQAIGQARFLPQVPRLMLPAPQGAPKNWAAYRARFVEPVRIRAGVRFWNEHAATLARAEREYGVPAEIIAGILGVETLYGQHMGSFRVMDALATLAFDFPAAHPRAAERQAFFQGELEQLLSLADRTGTDPFALRGSYAGAMGLGQFMPSSWVRWAVDFDGDGRIDLFQSPADAIGSVANYFQAHGWVPGLPTHYALAFDETRLRLPELLAPDILPTFDAAGMEARGARPLPAEGAATAPEAAGPLALIELQNGGAPATYVAGTRNFYVVTRYNWSSYYAMAVIDLGREVAAAR
ncbi:lytic murein transglycosylase B [Acidovorax sp. PRC11]|uniref:lytic murein transglycosylase B n=1 Tax=Acidovorax sp. PRC11 TaxID=2962592 RepID=UPI0028827320|nr:lytic murein transglycosylase B [Acidovorax sp. PRC11]MDT0140318.1 lytic murein transglycosylase B [Acidovorax sp. PRC11]